MQRTHVPRGNGSGHPISLATQSRDHEELVALQQKFEAGIASPDEARQWLSHLIAAAEQRNDKEAIVYLCRLLEKTTQGGTTAELAKLFSPDNPNEYLTWVKAGDLTLLADQETEPLDDEEQQALAQSVACEGLHQPLLLSWEHEIVAGRRRFRAGQDRIQHFPALVKNLTPERKRAAFLSTNLFVHTATPQRLFTRAQQYFACMRGMNGTSDDSRTPPPTDVPPNDLTLAERIATLPPGERQGLTRQLVLNDPGLQRALLEEAVQQLTDPEDKKRLSADLRHAKHALAHSAEQMTRYQQTIAKLEEEATAARVRQARLEDDIEELRQLRKELESGNRASAASLAELKERLQQVQPLERLATVAQARPVIAAVLAVVEAVGKHLLRPLFLYLHPSTAQQAFKELRRALDQIEALVRQCRQALATTAANGVPHNASATEEEHG